MTRDEVDRFARVVLQGLGVEEYPEAVVVVRRALSRAMARGAMEEREVCAKLCETRATEVAWLSDGDLRGGELRDMAAEIRARGEP